MKTFKYRRLYGIVTSNILLFHAYLKTTKYSDFKIWNKSEDKSLYLSFVEYIITNSLKHLWHGVVIFTAAQIFIGGFSAKYVIGFAITYWLLMRIIKLVRTRE